MMHSWFASKRVTFPIVPQQNTTFLSFYQFISSYTLYSLILTRKLAKEIVMHVVVGASNLRVSLRVASKSLVKVTRFFAFRIDLLLCE